MWGSTMSALRCLSLLILIHEAKGQCWGVTVEGSTDQPGINGYYYLMEDLRCNGYNVWIQQYNNDQYSTNYITFLTKNYNINNGTSIGGWTIGPSLCKTLSYVLAINEVSGYVSAPYELSNTWQAMDPSTGLFVPDPSLQVVCTTTLSVGAIVGIVIGCVCLLIMLFSLIACICAHHKKTPRRRTQHPTTTVTTVYSTNNPAAYSTNIPGQPAVIVAPPTYDNNAPPAYYETGYYNYGNQVKQPIE